MIWEWKWACKWWGTKNDPAKAGSFAFIIVPNRNNLLKIDKTSLFLVTILTLTGFFIRFYAPSVSVIPVNDGGLFYSMIEDLGSNHYLLPLVTSYNHADIPYAYPPFAFYLYGLIADLAHIQLLDLMRILPSFISALTIPALYTLALKVTESKGASILATAAFAFIPRAFEWIIMGGGATRSLGLLFALLALQRIYSLFSIGKSTDLIPAIIFSSLVVYTHPEAAVHTALSSIFFYLWLNRTRKGAVHAILIATGVLIITSPWWATIIQRHGLSVMLAPMTAVSQDNINLPARIFQLFIFQFTDEPLLDLFGLLGLIGMFTLFAHKRYLVPVWLLTIYLIEPRGSMLYIMTPLAIAIGYGLEKIILPGLNIADKPSTAHQDDSELPWEQHLLSGNMAKIFIVFVFAYGVMSSFYVVSESLINLTLTTQDLEALEWVHNNTPENGIFLVITQNHPLLDSSSEWFPALSNRKSAATVYGYEWVNDGFFGKRMNRARELQACASQDTPCLDTWYSSTNPAFVYIRKLKSNKPVDVPLIDHLQFSPQYEAIFENETVIIFRKSSER